MTTAPEWTYGDLIRKARTTAGLDQRQLASAVGVTQAAISKWERDKSRPDIAEFMRLVDATDALWLLDQVRDLAKRISVWESLPVAA